MTLLLLLLCAVQDKAATVEIRTAEAASVASVPPHELSEGEPGVRVGEGEARDILAAAGFAAAPFVREVGGRKIAFVADAQGARDAKADVVILVTAVSREQAAALLRESPATVALVSGRGGADPEPLRIGDRWMVQAPGTGSLWGRLELRFDGQGRLEGVRNRFGAAQGKPSEKVAALKKKAGVPEDPLPALLERPPAPAASAPALETGNRACRLRIQGMGERNAYGDRVPPAGKKLLVLDVELENIIPLTLIQSHKVPTQYKTNDLGDHLYVVANGNRLARIVADGSELPGHLKPAGFTLDRLGAVARGNLVFEVPAEGVRTLDLRFYDYAHGHMALALRAGEPPEAKPIVPLQQNEILEMGLFRAERLRELGERKAPDGMTFLRLEVRARSRMVTESDATAFDPKAKPGQKLAVGTVSDWTDARKHLHALVDGESSVEPDEELDLGEAPRFLPDVLTGGAVIFLVPEKPKSLEVRCDFPNARLPDGKVVHPKALTFLLEGKRPEPAAAKPAIVEIDDEVFKVAVTGQELVKEFAGAKPAEGSVFLRIDVTVTGAGKAGEQFQTPEQILYATEKGAQLPMHEATFAGPKAPAKLLMVPTGERRSFQAIFEIPETDRRPRLAYRGVSKAVIVPLKPFEAAARLCTQCKRKAEPAEKFCGECGTALPK
jgi:hypothetical protein